MLKKDVFMTESWHLIEHKFFSGKVSRKYLEEWLFVNKNVF